MAKQKLLLKPTMFKAERKANKKFLKSLDFNRDISKSIHRHIHHTTNVFSFTNFFSKISWL